MPYKHQQSPNAPRPLALRLQSSFRLLTILTLFALILTCTPPFQSASCWAADKPLLLVAPWEVKNADPANSGYVYGRLQIIETLVDVDHEGNLIPGLADRWVVTDNGLQYHFHIRDKVVFHDNTPLTAQAAAHSLHIILNKPGLLAKAPITNISAQGSDLVITLSEPYSILDAVLTHYSCSILAPAAYNEDGTVRQLIATGPYRVQTLSPPQKVEIQANPAYWKQSPEIQKVQYLAVGRNETRVMMAESGDADITYTLDPLALRRLEKKSNLQTYSISLPRTVVIKPNCAIDFLAEPALRKALSDSLDREGLALAVMKNADAAAYQLFPPGMGHWYRQEYDSPPANSKQFKGLLIERGWQENKEGYLQKNGKVAEVTLVTYSDRPELPVTATALQDQFKQQGIQLHVNITNSSVIPQQHQDNTLGLGLIARNYGLVANPLATIAMDYGPEGGDWGAMNWSHPDMQTALDALMATYDNKAQQKYIRDMTTLLHEEMPTIPIVYYMHSAVVSQKIDGFSLDPLERSYRLSELHWR